MGKTFKDMSYGSSKIKAYEKQKNSEQKKSTKVFFESQNMIFELEEPKKKFNKKR